MSALDFIKGGKALGVKQRKVEETWNVSGSLLLVAGQQVGTIEWERSSYMKKGANLNFYAYVSGSMYVCPELKREGYVQPTALKWGMPIPAHTEDDEEEE